MIEFSETKSVLQRDAWLSILGFLFLQIFYGFVLRPEASVPGFYYSASFLDYFFALSAMLVLIIYLGLRYGSIRWSEFLPRGLDIAVLFISFIILVIYTSILSFQGPYKPYTFQTNNKLEYLFIFFAIVLVGPLLEETLFRRYIFEIFRSKYKVSVAILLTTSAETFLHVWGLNIREVISTFLCLIFFTLVYLKSRLGVSIIIHCLANLFIATL